MLTKAKLDKYLKVVQKSYPELKKRTEIEWFAESGERIAVDIPDGSAEELVFHWTDLPGCCGVVVMHGLFVPTSFNEALVALFLGQINHSAVLATTAHGVGHEASLNPRELHAFLRRVGFKAINRGKNDYTGNTITTWLYKGRTR